MIVLEQLDNIRYKQPTQKAMQQTMRKMLRSFSRIQRKAIATAKSQYYLTSAIRDSKRAFWLNEDIALASIIIIATLSFSAVSLLANTAYVFLLTAHTISEVLRINMVPLTIIAMSVFTVIAAWILATLQNLLSISLMEGATRKKKRSLIATLRKSLGHASRTASSWLAVIATTLGPACAIMLVVAAIVYLARIPLEASLLYFVGFMCLGMFWIIWSLTGFALVPYVLLFEKVTTWREAFSRSSKLVEHKGRMFILSLYLALLASIAGVHYIAVFVENITRIDYTLTLWLLGVTVIFAANAQLTMLYRKRKLARK
jgi:hypothetical protein